MPEEKSLSSPVSSVRPLNRRLILAAKAVGGLVRLLHRLVRVSLEDPDGVVDSDISGLWCFWHNRALLVPAIYRSLRPTQKAIVLTSASRDGSFLAHVAASFGLEAARGSSSRRGGTALKQIVRKLREGYDAGVTPDGPRGPRYNMQPGVVVAAALAQRPVIPIELDFQACWRLKSWDRFIIPKPFTKITFRIGAPVTATGSKDHEIEALRVKLESQMRTCLRPE